jgi:hypothetical protein
MSSLWGEFKDLFVQEAVALRTPPPLADGMLPHDPKAMERLVRAAGKTGKAASIDEIVSQILEALGAPSWEKIKRLDPWELVEGGVDSYLAKKRQITEEEAFEIGETVGTVVGLITLERSLLGTDARQKWATKMPTHAHAVKAALSEGTPRALLRLLKHPLDRIKERLKQIAGSAGNVAHPLASKTAPKFQAAGRTTRFGMEALRDAVRAELRELSATLIELSSDPALESQLAALESAYKDKELPSLEALAGADDVPLRKAILFVMAHCFRMALGELDQAFRLLDDQKPLAGSLTLGGLLGLLHFSEDSLDNIAAFER